MISSVVGYLLGAGKPFYALALLGLILPQVYFQVNPFICVEKHEVNKPWPVGIVYFGFEAQVYNDKSNSCPLVTKLYCQN